MTSIPAEWTQAAVAITPGFEVSGDPYLGVTGDFDKMGISCGALQWNIGMGSLQPMVRAAGQAVVTAAMPIHGEEMWQACASPVSKGLAIVRKWQTNAKLRAKPKAELRALMGTAKMRAEQDARIDKVAGLAFAAAEKWAAARSDGKPSKRLFCWFFDLITQNGGLEGLSYADVSNFIAVNKPGRADDVICDFLASITGSSGHVKDANRNAAPWRNNVPGEELELLCMSYLRSKTAKPEWRHVVINRKGTIAAGAGWVNSSQFNFAPHGL